jgi:hypothetical protein
LLTDPIFLHRLQREKREWRSHVLETEAGRDKKVLLQSHADRQADRRFMTTSNEVLMSFLSTETFKTEMVWTVFFQNAIKQGNPICLDLPRTGRDSCL